jgi:hypothetical protein
MSAAATRLAAVGCLLASQLAQAATALILDPPPGFKLAEGQRRKVEVRIAIGDPAAEWRLTVAHASKDEPEITLAEGRGDVEGVVGEVAAEGLEVAAEHELRLHTVQGTHRVRFFIPDQKYVLIPLDPGDSRHSRMAGRTLDRDGGVAAYGALTPESVNILYRESGRIEQPATSSVASEGQVLSGDGRRFFYQGSFTFPGRRRGIGYLNIATGEEIGIAAGGDTFLFSVDHGGERVVFQRRVSSGRYQYHLHDGGGERQITDVSGGVVTGGGPLDCPRTLGSKPLITADGSRVILITRSTLGVEGAPEDAGCKVFAYDVDSEQIALLHAYPEGESLGLPTLSDDGRWLSHTISRVIAGGVRIAHGAWLDLETGEREDPIAGIVHQPTFDAVISPDGEKIVISTTADLDPRVGNRDGNMELYLVDRASGEITQVTDTTGGIGSRPGGCPTFRPSVSVGGEVIVSGFMVIDAENCRLDGHQVTSTSGMNLGKIRAVRKRPGNHGPVLGPLMPVHAEVGRTVELPFAATDPDGDPISLFIQLVGDFRIPDAARVVDRRDGTGLMTWPTRPEDRGRHRFRVAAFDEGGGETYEDVTITVSHSADCDGNGRVDTSEVRRCVASALGAAVPPDCRLCDADGDGAVTIDELVRGVVARGSVG